MPGVAVYAGLVFGHAMVGRGTFGGREERLIMGNGSKAISLWVRREAHAVSGGGCFVRRDHGLLEISLSPLFLSFAYPLSARRVPKGFRCVMRRYRERYVLRKYTGLYW